MKLFPFILLITIVILLAITTFVERSFGTPFVLHHFYGSWWMITLWAAIFATAFPLFINRLIKNRKPALMLHLSLGVILAGAFVSYLTSEHGQIHLREDGWTESSIKVPFSLTLNKFELDYYEGTTTPMDYISHLTLNEGEKKIETTISMNNIFKYKGFRFYQASYDQDLKGSILSISYDPFGITITYSGYLLLMLSMLWILFDKKGRFRSLIKSLSIICLLLISFTSQAQRTLTKEEAQIFGRLSMFYNERIVPIDTYASDFTKKITGKSSYKDFNAVQVLAGYIFFPEEWQEEQMIKIKDKEIRRFVRNNSANGNLLRLSDFFNSGVYKLSNEEMFEQHNKGMREADEKIGLILAQSTGSTMRIFPQGNHWYSMTDDLSSVNGEDTLFISKVLYMVSDLLQEEDHHSAIDLLNKIAVYQHKIVESSISDRKTQIEIFYNKLHTADILYKINLLLGVFAFVFFIWETLTVKNNQWINRILHLQLILAFAFLSVTLMLRWYISEHIPLSNIFETLMFAAWCIVLITLLFNKKSKVFTAAGLLLSGFILLVAALGAMNPQITKLVPVLMSHWLSIHVSLLMISYSLLAFMMFNGIAAIIIRLTVKNSDQHIVKLQIISKILLYPALFTLTAGIFIGAVWANISWGRYWGWDPKEVWALITMLVYSFAMHSHSLKVFRKTLFFHIYSILAFLTVLMTYFGVSLFFSGMHSY
ncbi:MAG: cytochrome c biogenesis protein CcsA [Tannerella sp.]|jgi:cytochrome c-type biogenesis protein CcsB|nr:cytochrome c biogenesis protein CcsA [Tannerella sp.]